MSGMAGYVFQPTYRNAGSIKHSSVWWICYSHAGCRKRESAGTKDKQTAVRFLQERQRLYSHDRGTNGLQIATKIDGLLKCSVPGTVGAISELLVAADLMNRRCEVFRALSPHSSCDLIALRGGQFWRIEVRTGRYTKNGFPHVTTPKDSDRFDVLACVARAGVIVYRPDVFSVPTTKEEANV